ncbi:hypothetical protein ABT354_14510 [Streptomyces sp. NPDC000594]|uniref:hypothetical protein n=1 Tax=Streptomyces sp. NPDC000594 TaxID=3154261 RepID=UPI00332036EA
MTGKRKNPGRYGTLLGVIAAVVLLPGLSPAGGYPPVWTTVVVALWFAVLVRLVSVYPHDVRGMDPVGLLVFGALGVLQDGLVLWGLDWIADRYDQGLASDGPLTIVLGALIIRGSAFAVLALAPSGQGARTG